MPPISIKPKDNPAVIQGVDVYQRDEREHMDVNVNSKQTMTPAVVLQAILMFGGLAGTFSTMVANDREHTARIDQMRADITRVEISTKDLKVEILGELREIRAELRERAKATR